MRLNTRLAGWLVLLHTSSSMNWKASEAAKPHSSGGKNVHVRHQEHGNNEQQEKSSALCGRETKTQKTYQSEPVRVVAQHIVLLY
jgi:hypothetical protein